MTLRPDKKRGHFTKQAHFSNTNIKNNQRNFQTTTKITKCKKTLIPARGTHRTARKLSQETNEPFRGRRTLSPSARREMLAVWRRSSTWKRSLASRWSMSTPWPTRSTDLSGGQAAGGGPLYEMKSVEGQQPSASKGVRSQNLLLALTLILTLILTLTPRVTVEQPHSSPVRPP